MKLLHFFNDSYTPYKLADIYWIHWVWNGPLRVSRGEGKPQWFIAQKVLCSQIMEWKEKVPHPEGALSNDWVVWNKGHDIIFLINICNAWNVETASWPKMQTMSGAVNGVEHGIKHTLPGSITCCGTLEKLLKFSFFNLYSGITMAAIWQGSCEDQMGYCLQLRCTSLQLASFGSSVERSDTKEGRIGNYKE